jgi:hypothetical protein
VGPGSVEETRSVGSLAMPDKDELDPGAPTEMFQAFVDRAEPEDPPTAWKWVAVAVAVLLAVALAAVLLLGG